MKLLIVEDEPLILNGIANMVRRSFGDTIEVAVASNGREGLELAESFRPDLVLTDIYMPELDGFGLIESLASRGICRRAAILSGYNDYSLVREALKFHTLDYLVKPVDEEELRALLKRAEAEASMENRRLREETLERIRNAALYGVPVGEEEDPALRGLCPYPYYALLAVRLRGSGDIADWLDELAARIGEEAAIHPLVLPEEHEYAVLLNTREPIASAIRIGLIDEPDSRDDALDISHAGISPSVEGIGQLPTLYRKALQDMRQPRGEERDEEAYSAGIRDILRHIEKHYNEPVSLGQIADVVHMHPAYVSSLFRKETGQTFIHYFHHYRIRMAMAAIIDDPDISFDALALRIGYETTSQFYKAFRKYAHMTPGQYRELYAGGAE